MKKTIQLKGMNCGHCVRAVERALAKLNGVSDVAVDLAKQLAVVETTPGISDAALKKAIADAGFEVLGIQ